MTAPTRDQLNVPLQESREPINDDYAFSEYALTKKDWRSQTIGKLKRHILGGRNSRGALQATSSILPTAANAGMDGVRWTLPSGSGLSTNRFNLNEPLKRVTPTQNGWWFVSVVGNTEIQENFVEFEAIRSASSETDLVFTTARGQRGQRIGMVQSTNGNWSLRSSANGLPANSVVKVYLAVI